MRLLSCCGSGEWARRLAEERPFETGDALADAADRIWQSLSKEDRLEAFAAHSRIGVRAGDAWARREQAGVDGLGEATRTALAHGNRDYEKRFGYVFLVCATGKTAEEMLGVLRGRLPNDAAAELRVAAEEQAKITRLRLDNLVTP